MATQVKGKTQTKTATRPATPSRPVSTGRGSAAAPAPARTHTPPAREPEPIEEEEVILDEEQGVMLPEELNQEQAGSGSGDDLLNLSTSELDSPARKADAHRGRILEILEHRSEQKGTPGIRIVLHSDDMDFDSRMDIYVPRPFAEDIRLDPRSLSNVKNEEAGTTNEQLQYAMGIHNKRKDATLDKLRAIATAEGRSLEGYTEPVETFADFCAALNTLCADMPLIFLRRPRKDNPQFVEVNDFLPMSALEDPKMQGKFKGKQLAWMSE